MTDHDELRALAASATPGPWGWRGMDDGQVELRGPGYYGPFDRRLLTTIKAEPCTAMTDPGPGATIMDQGDWVLLDGCCDTCRTIYAHPDEADELRCEKPDNLGTLWFTDATAGGGVLRPANAWAVRERYYRPDVVAVDHPDAAYIAAVSPDVVVGLLDEIAELRELVQEAKETDL